MCAGAIVNARIPKVYFGASDFKNGACGSYINLLDTAYNFRPEVTGGILGDECTALIKEFFIKLRNSR
jgi:tRNA(adenine34) deaminase